MEQAADAEGAGTIQALKTMDSLETKIQQVQTAYQQFYTSMGIESVWKSSLDWIRNVIDNLNDMPKAFGKIPVAAISAIGNLVSFLKNILIKALAKVVKLWDSTMKGLPKQGESEATSGAQQVGENLASKMAEGIRSKIPEIKKAAQEAVQAANEGMGLTQQAAPASTEVQKTQSWIKDIDKYYGFSSISNINKRIEKDYGKNPKDFLPNYAKLASGNDVKAYVDALKAQTQEAIPDPTTPLVEGAENVAETAGKASKMWGTLKNTIASARPVIAGLSTVFTTLSLSIDQSSRGGQQLAGVLQGIGAAMAFASATTPLGYINAALTTISAISTFYETGEEKAERLKEEAEELSNQAVLAKDEYKTLDTSVKKYEELKEKRYESTEATQEYEESLNRLAETYPQLVLGFDTMGNAIIDASAQERLLAELREKSAKATAEAAAKEAEAQVQNLKNAEKEAQNAGEILGNAVLPGFSTLIDSLGFAYHRGVNEAEAAYNNKVPPFQKVFFDYLKDATNFAGFSEDDEGVGIFSKGKKVVSIGSLQKLFWDFGEGIITLQEFIQGLNDTINDETLIKGIIGVLETVPEYEGYVSSLDDLEDQKAITKNARKLSLSTELGKQYYNSGFIQDGGAFTSLFSSHFEEDFLASDLTAAEFVEQQKASVESTLQQYENFWNTLSEDSRTSLNDMLGNPDKYSAEGIAEKYDLDDNFVKDLNTHWEEIYENNRERIAAINEGNAQLNNILKDDGNYTTKTVDAYAKLAEQTKKLQEQGLDNAVEGIVNGWNAIFTSINESNISQAQKDELLAYIGDMDLTSISGIFDAIKLIEDNTTLSPELKKVVIEGLEAIQNSLVVNLPLELAAIKETVIEKLEAFNEAIGDISKAMDYTDALKLYETMLAAVDNPELYDFASTFERSAENPAEYVMKDTALLKAYREKQIEDLEKYSRVLESAIENATGEGIGSGLRGNLMGARIEQWGKDNALTEEQLLNQLDEADRTTLRELGAIDDALKYVNGEIYYSTLIEALTSAASAAGMTKEAIDNMVASLGVSGEIEDALKLNKFGDARNAASGDQTYLNYINRTEEEAYADLLESFLSSSADQFAKDAYKYIGDVESDFNSLNTSDVSAQTVATIAAKAGYNQEQINEALAEYYDKKAFAPFTKGSLTSAFEDVISDPTAITNDVLATFATVIGFQLDSIIGWFKNNGDGTYSASYDTIKALVSGFGEEVPAAIQDALAEYLDSILGILKNGISGEMSQVEFDSLNDFFGGSLGLDFTKTAEGLKLTKRAAIEVYTELKKIDAVKAQIAFDDIAESLEEAGSGYETVADTMRTIAKLNEELANPDVSDARRKELVRELSVAEEILRVRSSDPDSFSFMDNDLPDGMQGPENYWNSIGDAYKAMNEATTSGFMEIQDFYNIVNQMDAMMAAAGQEFEVGGKNAAQLIEAGLGALSNIDGEGVKINLEKLGIDFLGGAEGMEAKFGDSMKVMAKSQIAMLDAAIQMLETIVAMEDLGNIDKNNNNIIELPEIIIDGEYTPNYDTVREALIGNEKLQGVLNEYFINGRSLLEWLKLDAAYFANETQEAQQAFTAAVNALWQMSVSDDYDLDNLLGSLSKLAEQYELAGTIITEIDEKGRQLIVKDGSFEALSIEWNSENTEKLLEKVKIPKEKAQEQVRNWALGQETENLNLPLIYQLTGQVSIDDENNYVFLGHKYTTEDELTQAIANYETISSFEGTVSSPKSGKFISTIQYSGMEVKIEIGETNEPVFTSTYGGKKYTGASEDEIFHQIYADNAGFLRTEGISYEEFVADQKATISPEVQVAPVFTTAELGEDGKITQEIIDAYSIDTAQMNTISAALTTAMEPLGETITTAIQEAFKPEEGETGLNIGDLTVKPTSITIDATDIIPTIDGIGEDGNVSIPTITISTEGLNENAIALIEAYNDAITVASEKGTVESGVSITLTGLDDTTAEKITSYTDAVEGLPAQKVSSEVESTVNIPAIDLLKILQLKNALLAIQESPDVDASIKATAEGNALEVVKDILAAYGYSGQTAELIFNAIDNNTISGILTQIEAIANSSPEVIITANLNDDAAQKAIEELTKDETKNITITYTPPTKVGPDTDTSNSGYEVYGTDNLNGNRSRVGVYENAEQTIAAVSAAVETGTFQNGEFEITEIKADGSTISMTASLVELSSILGNSNNTNSNTSTNPTTPKAITQTPTIGALDLSGLATQVQTVGTASTTASTELATAASALSNVDTSPLGSATNRLNALANAARSIPSSGASRINNLASAIRNIPTSKSIQINYKVSVSTSGSGVTGAITSATGNVSSWGKNSASGNLSSAKGNIALASGTRKTLMGELGPELVVSNGHYFIAGRNGAEFVELADDAIVFNHLQTKKLLSSGSSGRGVPITNERKATSLATGNVEGPALASASAALAQLRQIRAMWQSLLDASMSDLGSKAGLGKGGGGGGGGGGNADNSAIPYDLEQWYNWLRKIAKLEQQITLEQAKRENMTNGYDRAASLSKELSLLEDQYAVEKSLADAQYEYYLARMKEVNESDYGKIIHFDEDGLLQFRTEEGLGLDLLADIKGKETATAQLAAIKAAGFDTGDALLYNENGQKINTKGMSKEEIAKAKVENFFNNVDLTKEELEELYDSVNEHQTKMEEVTQKQNEILQSRIDNQLEVEQMIYDTIVNMREQEIEALEDQKAVLEEASKSYLDGLNKALDKELSMYNKAQTQEETTKLQRQLAILQRSGGSASEIRSLQEQIDSRLKDQYFTEQQDQIDAIQEASDREIERLDTQINRLTEILDYEKENGLIWEEVADWLLKPEDEILSFITTSNEDYLSKSLEGQKEFLKEFTLILQEFFGNKQMEKAENAAKDYVEAATKEGGKYAGASKETISSAKKAYQDAYKTNGGDEALAQAAADKILSGSVADKKEDKKDEEQTASKYDFTKVEVKKGKWNIRSGAGTSHNSIGRVNGGKELEFLGETQEVKGQVWYKVKYGGKEGWISGKGAKPIKGYSQGGLVDYTGLAMVHGTKSHPESFLSAKDTELLKSTIFNGRSNALDQLIELYKNYNSSKYLNGLGTNITIGNFDVNVSTEAITDTYSAKAAGQDIFDEMVRLARKSANINLSRR